jgi:hypothetical protein
MKKAEVFVVYDLDGNILSITRLSENAPQGIRLTPMAGAGRQVYKTELPIDEIEKIVSTHRFDPRRNILLPY